MLEPFVSKSNVLTLMIVVGIVGVISEIFQIKKRKRVLEEIFNRQALKYNGIVEGGGFLGTPHLKIRYKHAKTELFIDARRKQNFTVFSAIFYVSVPYKVRIYREYRFLGIGTVFGQDVKIHNPEFDEAFVIQGTDETIVRHFLTMDIQSKLLLMKDDNPVVEIQDGILEICIPRILEEDRTYESLLEVGLAMVEKAWEIK